MKGIKNIGSILVVIASILGIIFAATLMGYSVAVGVWGIILSAVSLLLGFLTFANTKSTVSTIFVITFILAIITASFSVGGLEKSMILQLIASIIGFIGTIALPKSSSAHAI
ncbi:hypothetical protein [Cysteiniphilum sp. QT6929]|uniref:hypothetical protein n=1 Tax=Cysteiniphilum TaxID=2056696 RepID=UPI0024B34B2C|nr:hypothetical protein [Cysteiniphilum sp. QT6929]WHN64583.1 hypothetical protein NYP54_05855 [Cysteiniphilum sp. QT6929]